MTSLPTFPKPVFDRTYKLHIPLLALQTHGSRPRGIGRYLQDIVSSILNDDPGLVAGLYFDPGRQYSHLAALFAGHNLLKPLTYCRPQDKRSNVDIYHLIPPFELNLPLTGMLPPQPFSQSFVSVATLFDLIPLALPEAYLQTPELRRLFNHRQRLFREADHIIAISESTRKDAINYLELAASKISVVYPAVSPLFYPPDGPRSEVLSQLKRAFPDLIKGPFILYVSGGVDPRKNTAALITAFSQLPRHIFEKYHLVIIAPDPPSRFSAAQDLAKKLHVAQRVVFASRLGDDVLRDLYQACELFVYPSLYEGFGLPVVEAMKSGAPTLVGDNTSLKEIVEINDARFDASNIDDMARCITRALTEETFRQTLSEYSLQRSEAFTPKRSAEQLRRVYELLASDHRVWTVRRPRMVVAFCTPYPPERSGIASDSDRIIRTLVSKYPVNVEVVVKGNPEDYRAPPHHVELITANQFRLRARRGYYDSIVYCMGNSQYHDTIYDLLKEIPGIVWMHDVCYLDFYRYYFESRGRSVWPLPVELREWTSRYSEYTEVALTLPTHRLEQHGVFLAGEIASFAKKIIVNSQFAEEIVRLESSREVPIVQFPLAQYPLDSEKWDWVSLARKFNLPTWKRVIISAGFMNEIKWPGLIAEAFADVHRIHGDTALVFVGDCPPWVYERLMRQMKRTEALRSVRFTGYVSDEEFLGWLKAAACALQLRYPATGGAAGTVMRSLAMGVATIVSNNGPFRELPDGVVYKVGTPPTKVDIRDALLEVLGNPEGARKKKEAALVYSKARSIDAAATRLWELLSS